MGPPKNLLPELGRTEFDHRLVFEQLPHPIVLLSPELSICEVNAAGRRFLGQPSTDLSGLALFDILPQSRPGGSDWQSRLRASYDEVVDLREPVMLLLSTRQETVLEATAETTAETIVTAPTLRAGTGMWHVCHGPIIDEGGTLVAIATHALALCGIEAAIAQASSFATTQLFSVNHSPGSVVDAPTATTGAESLKIVVDDTVRATGQVDDYALPNNGQPMAILMVEDNQDLRSSTAELLQFLGHRVVSVPDAELALRQLESCAFDILFTDLTLPKMSGAELARHVLQHHRPTRVIITSGYGRAMANAQNLDAVFLPKPYRVADLEEVLAKLPVGRA